MEERVHPAFIVGIYEGNSIRILATADDESQLKSRIIELIEGGETSPGRFVILQPIEGVSVKLDPIIELNIPESADWSREQHDRDNQRRTRSNLNQP